MSKYDKALNLFTGYDSFRDFVNAPFRQGRYVYATDSICMIRIDAEYLEMEYNSIDKPNCGYSFNKKPNQPSTHSFSLEGLKSMYDRIPDVEFEECEACDGTGKVDFEFEYDCEFYYKRADCPICYGEGYVQVSEPEKDFRYGIKFADGSSPVRQKYLLRLIEALRTLDLDRAFLVYADDTTFMFELEQGIDVMMMGYLPYIKNEEFFISYEDVKEEES